MQMHKGRRAHSRLKISCFNQVADGVSDKLQGGSEDQLCGKQRCVSNKSLHLMSERVTLSFMSGECLDIMPCRPLGDGVVEGHHIQKPDA